MSSREPNTTKHPGSLPLSERVALRIDEAAELLGISEGAFRDHLLADCPKLYVGRAVLIPRLLFAEYIERLALAEKNELCATADELLAGLDT